MEINTFELNDYTLGMITAVDRIYNYIFSKEDMETEEFKEYGVVHVFEDDFEAFLKEQFNWEPRK